MKIEIGNVLPNPYRNLPEYPIDPAKIERLTASIKKTGFWDNIVGRKVKDGKVEIAYGHHRLTALRKMYPKTHEIQLITRDLDDGTMIQIMAAENDEVYSLMPGVINETVKAARDYLKLSRGGQIRISVAIADFLGWNERRVRESLAQLSDIEDGVIDKDVIESLPNQRAAEEFRHAVKKHKAPKSTHRFLADKVKTGKIGSRQVADEVIKQRYKREKDSPVQLEQYMWEVKNNANRLIASLEKLATAKDVIDGAVYSKSFEKLELFRSLSNLSEMIARVTGGSHGRTGKENRKLLRG